ncbi:44571_t:CDS:2 [Gigaspora margarita]|uniref:44571_t:CDS:1 n=1 Tax=Gigaspora margarita TaxID=4874 RepID=A0ABN7UZH5_GIGMA|nr:44571_t:CDS:2 [Gigaspora margarita]
MGKRQNSKTVELINQISQTSDNIPPFSTPQLYSRKNITSIFQNLQNTSQLSQENPQTTTFDSSILATSSDTSTFTLSTKPIVLSTQSLANPLSNINTNKTFQTSQSQSFVKHTYSSKLKPQTNPLSSTLGPLTPTENLQHSSMDIDNTSTNQLI